MRPFLEMFIIIRPIPREKDHNPNFTTNIHKIILLKLLKSILLINHIQEILHDVLIPYVTHIAPLTMWLIQNSPAFIEQSASFIARKSEDTFGFQRFTLIAVDVPLL